MDYSLDLSGSIRDDFHNGENSHDSLIDIINNDSYAQTAVTKAYKGLCETMLANHSIWPVAKLNYFLRGKIRIEESVIADPENAEIRYIRLLVQLNAPSWLGYNQNIESDFAYFIKNVTLLSLSDQMQMTFVSNLLACQYVSREQINSLVSIEKQIRDSENDHLVGIN